MYHTWLYVWHSYNRESPREQGTMTANPLDSGQSISSAAHNKPIEQDDALQPLSSSHTCMYHLQAIEETENRFRDEADIRKIHSGRPVRWQLDVYD